MKRISVSIVIASALAAVVACGGSPAKSAKELVEDGDRLAASGKQAEAIILYRNAVKQDPKGPDAHARLADAYLKTKDLKNSLREHVVTADLMPDNIDAQLKAGQFLALARRFEDARARADNVLALDPDNVSARVLSATAGVKDLDTAIQSINDTIKVDPTDALSYTTLGTLQMSKGRRAEAERAFLQAVDAKPTSASTHLALANFYWSTNQQSKAEAPLKRAVGIEPSNVAAQRALARLYLSARRTKDAEEPLKVVAETMKDVSSRLALADYYLSARRTGEGLRLLKALAAEKDGFGPAMLRLAAFDRSNNHAAEAHSAVDEVLRRSPKDVDALVLKTRFLLADRRFDEALVRAKAAVAVRIEAFGHLAALYVSQKKLDQAKTEYERLAREQPNSVAAPTMVGLILEAQGKTAEARAAYEKVIAARPEAGLAANNLAWLYAENGGNLDVALQLAQSAIRQMPNVPQVNDTLGWIYYKKDLPELAIPALSEAVRAVPKNPNYQFHLGLAYAKADEKAKALNAFDVALALKPDFQEAATARSQLRQ